MSTRSCQSALPSPSVSRTNQTVRRLHDEHAVLVELETGRAVEVVEKRRALVGPAVAVRVFEDEQAVAVLAPGRALRVIRPGRDPQPAFRVPGHLHRIDEFGELLLRWRRDSPSAFGTVMRLIASSRIEKRAFGRARLVGRHLRDRRRVAVVDRVVSIAAPAPPPRRACRDSRSSRRAPTSPPASPCSW